MLTESGRAETPPAAPPRRGVWLAGAVAAVVLAAGGAITLSLLNRPTPPTAETSAGPPAVAVDAIAVLPFVYAGQDAEHEYLADMIPGTLIKSLSEVKELRVRPMSSVAGYGGKQKGLNLRNVGRELEVRAVVTGTVQSRKDGLLVGVELVDVTDNRVLWSEQYDRQPTDLQAVHTDISRNVCAKLNVRLSGHEERRLSKRYTENTEAYLLYLEGLHWLNKWTPEGFKKAIRCQERALALDPNNALAHAERSQAYVYACYEYLSPADARPVATASANRALELDDELAEAHIAMGIIRMYFDWDWDGAGRELRQGVQMNPRYAGDRSCYAWYLACTGRDEEAIAEARHALQLEPRSAGISTDVTYIYYVTRRYPAAAEQAARTLELDSDDARSLEVLSYLFADKKDFRTAKSYAEKIVSADDPTSGTVLATVNALAGDRAGPLQYLQELDRLSRRQYVRADLRSEIYVAMGEHELALDWLDKAVEERSVGLAYIKVFPLYDPLRSHPRFQAILKKMNLSP